MARKRARINSDSVFTNTAGETSKRFDGKTANKKIKNTIWMTPETTYRLEDAHLKLRRITGLKLSKSEIIETALKLALSDFEAQGKSSEFAVLMAKRQN